MRPLALAGCWFLFLAAVAAATADPPEAARDKTDPPKAKRSEPTHAGRPLSAWVKDLEAPEKDKQLQAIRALKKMGPAARSAVLPLLALSFKESEDQAVRSEAETAARAIGLPKVASLVRVLKRWQTQSNFRPTRQRVLVLRTLTMHGAGVAPAIPVLVRELEGVDVSQVQVSKQDRQDQLLGTALALQAAGKPAIAALIQAGTRAIKESPAHALGRVAVALLLIGREAVPQLRDALKSERSAQRQFAAATLGEMGPWALDSVDDLRRLEKDGKDPQTRRLARQARQTIAYESFKYQVGGLAGTGAAGALPAAALAQTVPGTAPPVPEKPEDPLKALRIGKPPPVPVKAPKFTWIRGLKLLVLVLVLLGSIGGWLSRKSSKTADPSAETPAAATAAAGMACPRCAFSYKWDGSRCDHCGHVEDEILPPEESGVENEVPGLAERIAQILEGYNAESGLYLAPNIPEKKLTNATAKAQVPTDETVLALIDCTTFGSASDSLIFGSRGFYYHNIAGSNPNPGCVLYNEFPECHFATSWLSCITLGEDRYCSNSGGSMARTRILELLADIKQAAIEFHA